MTTLKEISRRSGYSVTTVSRALNGHADVTDDTRQRIEAIARALNYRPNQVARKLVLGRSGMVGMALDAPPRPFEYGHFFHIIAGCSRAFSERDMDFVLHIDAGGEAGATYARLINRGTLDGFIVTAPGVDDPRISLLLGNATPFVVHGRDPAQGGYASFDIDNHALACASVDHLADLGHRRIALVNGPATMGYASERLRGYRDALARRGLPFEPGLVLNGDTSADYGASAFATLTARPEPASAIVCCNSLVAGAVLAGARAAGIAVPRDLSIIAHDDVLPQADTATFDPPLTITRAALADAAATLADLLVRRIAGEAPETLCVVETAEMVLRASTAPPVT